MGTKLAGGNGIREISLWGTVFAGKTVSDVKPPGAGYGTLNPDFTGFLIDQFEEAAREGNYQLRVELPGEGKSRHEFRVYRNPGESEIHCIEASSTDRKIWKPLGLPYGLARTQQPAVGVKEIKLK
ncbi:MAG: hypothetical protein V1703_02830 [Candidatus Altiarchaeota archaeon]